MAKLNLARESTKPYTPIQSRVARRVLTARRPTLSAHPTVASVSTTYISVYNHGTAINEKEREQKTRWRINKAPAVVAATVPLLFCSGAAGGASFFFFTFLTQRWRVPPDSKRFHRFVPRAAEAAPKDNAPQDKGRPVESYWTAGWGRTRSQTCPPLYPGQRCLRSPLAAGCGPGFFYLCPLA